EAADIQLLRVDPRAAEARHHNVALPRRADDPVVARDRRAVLDAQASVTEKTDVDPPAVFPRRIRTGHQHFADAAIEADRTAGAEDIAAVGDVQRTVATVTDGQIADRPGRGIAATVAAGDRNDALVAGIGSDKPVRAGQRAAAGKPQFAVAAIDVARDARRAAEY